MQHRPSQLLLNHLYGTITVPEQEELNAWLDASEEHRALFTELTNEAGLSAQLDEVPTLQERIREKIYSQLPEARPSVPLYRRMVFRIAAAAAIIALMVLGYYQVNRQQTTDDQMVVAKSPDIAAPATARATITLANGQQVDLDRAGNGMLVMQEGVEVVKTAEGIEYRASGYKLQAASLVYHTLTNPRGSKVIDMRLSDGTRVWLNAGSSMRYPVVFGEEERRVSITGEAYFEVKSKNSKVKTGVPNEGRVRTAGDAIPFFVESNGLVTEVLGTHFNVNAYDDEEDIKVTLLEGKVRVSNGKGQTATLKPGEQAISFVHRSPGEGGVKSQSAPSAESVIQVHRNVDLQSAISWKNGLFQFSNAPIETIMRQVGRWYDVEVVYSGAVRQRFNGKIPRNVNASDLFRILESTGWVHFKIEGKKVTVSP